MDKIRFVRDIVRVTPCLSPCDAESSSVSAINANSQKQEIFDISGRKLDSPQKGVNIINEKKYVVK